MAPVTLVIPDAPGDTTFLIKDREVFQISSSRRY